MASKTLVSVREYLATSYRPDREYVDGELLERNVGEWDHSRLQALLLKYLLQYEEELGLLVVPEQRIQVRPSRFRVPDLCVCAATLGSRSLLGLPCSALRSYRPRTL